MKTKKQSILKWASNVTKNSKNKLVEKAGVATVEIIAITLVVIVIIAVLVMPALTNQINKSTEAVDKKLDIITNFNGKP